MNHALVTFLRLLTLSAARYFIIAGAAFLLFYVLFKNWLSQAKIQSRKASTTDFLREILHSFQTTAIFAVIGFIVFYTPFKGFTKVYTNLSDYPTWWVGAAFLLSLVLHDTYFYWMHRLLHDKRLFKLAHVLHHKSTNPSPWASYSFHFIEAWFEGAVLLIIVLIIPMHPITVILFTVGGFVINVYGHLGYEILPKQFRHTLLFQVFNTSVYHNLHHSKFKGNYSLYFRLWDRLLKTEHPDYVKEYDRIQKNRFGE